MSTTKKGILVVPKEWWKHLRPFLKRNTWHRERRAEKREMSREISDSE